MMTFVATAQRERNDIAVKRGPGRLVFVCAGCVSVALGAVGAVVPGMPTTIFLIIASYLFARSSPALDARLHRNRWLGPSLRRFHESGGMARRAKIVALASMWTGVTLSAIALARVSTTAQIATIGLGVVGTITLLWFVRTTPDDPDVAD
jgi:uncharacterized protein